MHAAGLVISIHARTCCATHRQPFILWRAGSEKNETTWILNNAKQMKSVGNPD